MATINWDLTIDTIQSGKCILFLGPEVFTNAQDQRLEDRLLAYLKVKEDQQVQVYDDGLFYFKERPKRTETYLRIRRFFQEEDFSEAEQIFEQIAQIPFHFIIGITPDSKLRSVFEARQLKFRHGFYWKKQRGEGHVKIPTPKEPLLYNMLGSIDRPESLVLTHSDLFDYLESIFQGNSISNTLRDHILSDAQSIIFLGIPFDRWYMQLIMRMLHLHKDKDFMRFADSQSVSEEICTFGKDEFKINFVPTNISSFVQEIYTRCTHRQLLRTTPSTNDTSFIDRLKEKYRKGKISEIFDPFEQWLDDLGQRDLLNELDNLMSRHRRHRRKVNGNVLSFEQVNIEDNKINETMLNLLNQAAKLE